MGQPKIRLRPSRGTWPGCKSIGTVPPLKGAGRSARHRAQIVLVGRPLVPPQETSSPRVPTDGLLVDRLDTLGFVFRQVYELARAGTIG